MTAMHLMVGSGLLLSATCAALLWRIIHLSKIDREMRESERAALIALYVQRLEAAKSIGDKRLELEVRRTAMLNGVDVDAAWEAKQ